MEPSSYFDYRRFEALPKEKKKKRDIGLDIFLNTVHVDETTLEARSLIDTWVNGGTKTTEHIELDEFGRFRKVDVLKEAQEILKHVKTDVEIPVAARDLGLAMKVRRATSSKRQEKGKTNAKPSLKTQHSEPVSKPLSKKERVKQGIMERVLALELQQELKVITKEIAPAAESTLPKPTVIKPVEAIKPPKPKPIVDITPPHLFTLLNSYNQTKSKKTLRLVFTQWSKPLSKNNHLIASFQSISHFHVLSKIFTIWTNKAKQVLRHRAILAQQEELKQQRRLYTKADSYHRLSMLEKVLRGWKWVVESEKIEQQVKREKIKRREGIANYLKALEQKFQAQCTVMVDAGDHQESSPVSPVPSVTLGPKTVEEAQVTMDTIVANESNTINEALISHQQSNQPATIAHATPRVRPPKQKHVIKTDKRFLQSLEARQKERELRKQTFLEQKQQREERLALAKQQKEQEARELEMQQKLELEIERKRLEEETKRVMEEQKRIKVENQKKYQRAVLHHQNRVLLKGLNSLKSNVVLVKRDYERATRHYDIDVQAHYYCVLADRLEQSQEKKLAKGDKVYHKHLLSRTFKQLKQTTHERQKLNLLSTHHYSSHLLSNVYQCLREILSKRKAARVKRESVQNTLADRLACRLVPKRWIRKWISAVKEQKEERWREYRLERMREVARSALSTSLLETDQSTFESSIQFDLMDCEAMSYDSDHSTTNPALTNLEISSFSGPLDLPEFTIYPMDQES